MDDMDYHYYGGRQSYPQTPVQNRFDQRRLSTSASHPQSQTFHPTSFQPPVQNFQLPNQYDFSQTNEWVADNDELTAPPTFNASNFNPTDIIDQFTSSAHVAPWDPTGRSKARGLENSLQFTSNTAQDIPKANTVAGPLRSPDVFKRPNFRPQRSYVSIADSGYGSQPTQHDGITTSSQPEAKDNCTLPLGPHSLRNSAHPPPPSSVKTEPNLGIKRRRSKSFATICHCGRELKNRSEAVKHKLQHDKPYRCDMCSRKEGFATQNDLERHRKSVHGANPRVGKAAVYVCQACKPSPGSKPKVWPRLDNFKAHVKRKHLPPDLDLFIRCSEIDQPPYPSSQYAWSQPTMSNPPEDMNYQQDMSSPVGHHMTRHGSQQHQMGDYNPLFGRDSAQQLAHVGGAGEFQGDSTPAVQFREPIYQGGNPMMTLIDVAQQQLTSPVDEMSISPTGTRYSIPRISVNGQDYDQYDNHEEMNGPIAKRMRTQHPHSPTASQSSIISAVNSAHSASNSTGHPDGEYPCPRCTKVKKRECDLRKHMKRHTRPYGCTFAKCNKRFGSRNDWKRHENSQHFLSEMWRCSLKGAKDTKCGHLSHDSQQFAKHLETHHDIKGGSEEMKAQCRSMHLGREGHHHFWCGFCDKLIEQAGGIQPGAWDVRFKHIGDHFDKDNLNIDDWVDIEKNKKKKLIENEEKARNASLKTKINDDDSDLGEDGIPSFPVNYGGHAVTARRMVNEEAEADAEGVSDDDL